MKSISKLTTKNHLTGYLRSVIVTVGDIIARKNKKVDKKAKAAGKFKCKHCGKKLKTKKGLAGHESRCAEKHEMEEVASLASETMEILGLSEDEIEKAMDEYDDDLVGTKDDKTTRPPKEVNKLKNELESELARLKSQFQRQNHEEKKLQQERKTLQNERNEFYKNMTDTQVKKTASILDPFGDGFGEETEPPSISGPVAGAKKPGTKPVKGDVKIKSNKEGAKEPADGEVDIKERTERLRKDLQMHPDSPDIETSDKGAVAVLTAPEELGVTPEGLFTGGAQIEEIISIIRHRLESEFGERLVEQDAGLDQLQQALQNQDNLIKKLEKTLEKLALKETVNELKRNLNKTEIKVNEMAEEVGFGESMNVAKIPPSILVSVYEATLDDAIKAMTRNIGPYDVESVVTSIIEDIRTQTSGSELFKYENGKLRIKDLARNLESRAISAKQIQATYSELLNRIIDYAPGYKPKNFRAILKIKSQEFAVDKTSDLMEIFGQIQKGVEQVQKANTELSERLEDLEETRNTLASDVRVIEQKLNEMAVKLGINEETASDDSVDNDSGDIENEDESSDESEQTDESSSNED
jgi:DNA repair exonuclease SbcCD ATPase subunit